MGPVPNRRDPWSRQGSLLKNFLPIFTRIDQVFFPHDSTHALIFRLP